MGRERGREQVKTISAWWCHDETTSFIVPWEKNKERPKRLKLLFSSTLRFPVAVGSAGSWAVPACFLNTLNPFPWRTCRDETETEIEQESWFSYKDSLLLSSVFHLVPEKAAGHGESLPAQHSSPIQLEVSSGPHFHLTWVITSLHQQDNIKHLKLCLR